MRLICLVGDTCAGKTTLGKMLASNKKVPYISTGDIARSMMDNQTDQLFASGKLSPHGSRIMETLEHELRKADIDGKKAMILDGCPRTEVDKTIIEGWFKKHFTGSYPCAVLIDVPFEICLGRAFQRQRDKFDTADILRQRHELYERETKPVFEGMERDRWLKFALRLKTECQVGVMYHNLERVYRAYVGGHMDHKEVAQ